MQSKACIITRKSKNSLLPNLKTRTLNIITQSKTCNITRKSKPKNYQITKNENFKQLREKNLITQNLKQDD